MRLILAATVLLLGGWVIVRMLHNAQFELIEHPGTDQLSLTGLALVSVSHGVTV